MRIYSLLISNVITLFFQFIAIAQTTTNNPCKVYADEGYKYAKSGNYTAAEKSYTDAIACDSTDVSLYINRGTMRCMFLKNSIGGMADYSKAQELNPNDPAVYYYRGMFYRGAKEYQASMDEYNKGLELNAAFSEIYYERGLLYMFDFKKYEIAIHDFNKCLELDKTAKHVYQYRAYCYNALGKYQEALADYDIAIKNNEKDVNLYFNRAIVNKSLKNYTSANNDYTKAIQMDPGNGKYYYGKGVIWENRLNYDSAIVYLSKAIELSPTSSSYYVERGFSQEKLKNYKAAETDYTKAISLDPSVAMYYINRARSYQAHSEYNLAITDYNTAEKLFTGKAKVSFFMERGNARFALKQYPESIVDYSKVIEMDKAYSNAYLYLGQAHFYLGDYEAALANFVNGDIVNSSNIGELNHWRGKSVAKLGRYDEALTYYDAAILNKQDDPQLYRERADIQMNLKNDVAAQKDRDIATQLETQNILEKPGVLKRPLTKRDSVWLANISREAFPVKFELVLTLDSYDLFAAAKKETEEAASLGKALELENKFLSDTTNYDLCFKTALMYKRINNSKKANYYFNTNLRMLHARLDKKPADVEAYLSVGLVYSQIDEYYKAIDAFETYYKYYPESDSLKDLEAMCLIATNNMTKMYEIGMKNVKEHPESAFSYICINMAVMGDTMSRLEFPVLNASNKKLEDIIYFSTLEAACKKYPDNFELKLIYEMLQQFTLTIKIISEDFKLTMYDKEQIAQMDAFFQAALKRNDFSNKAPIYKALGNLYFIAGDYKKAVPYLNKAIELKSNSVNTTFSNAGGLYNQLTATYLKMGDTLSAQKLQEKRIVKKPEIDSKAKDYSDMARYFFYYKKYDLAKENCYKALAIDSLCADAYMGLAALALIKEDGDAAINICMGTTKLTNQYDDLFTQSAIAWMLKKDYASAYYCLNKVLLSDPQATVAKKIRDTYYEK